MRYNLSKTKRRPRSNKKGALKGLRNNKTKVVKKQRIEQRGGGTYQALIQYIRTNNTIAVANYIRREIEPSLNHQFVERNPEVGGDPITGPTALYTACSLLEPNPNLVNTLLFFGFNPNTPNNDGDRSYPQHGVVAAAGAIISSGDPDFSKKQKLRNLVNVLGLLRNYAAQMDNTNTSGDTAMGEYINKNQGHNSIYQAINSLDQELSTSISHLLSSATPPTPIVYVVQPSKDALPPCELSVLPESQHYSIEPNSSFGFKSKYYFIYNGQNYYFCTKINDSITRAFSDSTQAGQPGSINTFNVTNEDTDTGVPTTFNFSYKRSQIPAVGMSIPYLGPELVSFNIKDHGCRITNAAVRMLP
jgi:hypothetical protein